MKRTPIEMTEYALQLLKALPKGILVTTKAEKPNSMVIGWGHLGYEWSTPIFVVYVRQHRFTKSQLEANPEFTINVPLDTIDPNILKVCGSLSGKNVDKEKEAGLTYVDGVDVSVPGVKECPITLECKVVFQNDQPIADIDEKFQRFYPQDVDGSFPMANRDCHTAYYAEIVNAYIIEDQ